MKLTVDGHFETLRDMTMDDLERMSYLAVTQGERHLLHGRLTMSGFWTGVIRLILFEKSRRRIEGAEALRELGVGVPDTIADAEDLGDANLLDVFETVPELEEIERKQLISAVTIVRNHMALQDRPAIAEFLFDLGTVLGAEGAW